MPCIRSLLAKYGVVTMSPAARKRVPILPDAFVPTSAVYDAGCRRCTRLADFLDAVKTEHPTYFCRPVPPFGDPGARLVIVGPGARGCTARTRAAGPSPATSPGILLYETLHAYGFASLADYHRARDDGLQA